MFLHKLFIVYEFQLLVSSLFQSPTSTNATYLTGATLEDDMLAKSKAKTMATEAVLGPFFELSKMDGQTKNREVEHICIVRIKCIKYHHCNFDYQFDQSGFAICTWRKHQDRFKP